MYTPRSVPGTCGPPLWVVITVITDGLYTICHNDFTLFAVERHINFFYFFQRFSLCGPPFKVFIEFLTILLLFYVLVFLALSHMES